MADSTHSIPSSRRNVLVGLGAAAATLVPMAASASATVDSNVEAVLEAWRAWRALEEEDIRLNFKIKWKLQMVPSWAQVPGITVFETFCLTEDCIDDACNAAPAWVQPAVPEIRKQAKAEFSAVWRRREELYEKIGLAKLEARQDEIVNLQVPHIKLIENAPGSHPVIVAAKLDMSIAQCDSSSHLSDLPQGYICDAMRGLLPDLPEEMREKMATIAAADDIVKAVYWPRPADCPKSADEVVS
jgi:hypothetical protein